jgi:hypothetical protein
MKCTLCDQRKGKRPCPAKGSLICAPCCGEKRILEIDCPESCEYLKVGRNHEMNEYMRHIRTGDQLKLEKRQRILDSFSDVVGSLEGYLAEERLRSKDLTDADAIEALGLLLDTYRTEDKGILFERTSHNLRVDMLRKEVRNIIELYRNPQKEQRDGMISVDEKRLPLGAAIDCLDFVHDLALSHIQAQASPTSYVDLLARLVPRKKSKDDGRSSIIIP